ncbi:hypothetical protein AgCh_034932 [Apium graveolens]
MNGVKESHCPTCRHPYHHFPNICQMFHFLLRKMYPITYKMRETQILEFEKARDCFSPELKDPVCASRNSEKLCHLGDAGQSYLTNTTECSSLKGSSGDGPAASDLKELVFSSSVKGFCKNQPEENSSGGFGVTQNQAVEKNVMSKGDNGTHVRVSITDMLCVACNELLFRPIVLNCGHVYCETCISIPADEKLRCQLCQSLHPKGIPKVCLELHHLLGTQFPTEYELQKYKIKHIDSQQELPTILSAEGSKQSGHFSLSSDENLYPSWADRTVHLHFGVGCDFCGMYPILGTRYRCKDCVEVIGFDLCADCYTTRSELPGKFNQQHTPEHRFDIIGSDPIRRIISRMIRGDAVNITGAPVIPGTDVENPENVIAPAVAVEEIVENELVSLQTSASNSEEQSGEQSPTM